MDPVTAEIVGSPIRYQMDGVADDLLTAGLGLAGLRADAPGCANPLQPTRRELRRRAIWSNWRGLMDLSDTGGFGRLFGPVGDLRVAGVEYLAAVRTPDGRGTTTVMLQVPADFDAARPCLLAVASPGSRGIYGALPNAAQWGLMRGCAVVHTDKGTGAGVWDVDRGRGYRIDGSVTDDPRDPLATFAPPLSPELARYGAAAPHSLLFKHAHSGLNPEADWGKYLLQAIAVAFELLNAEFAARGRPRLTPDNTLVLAAGVSNGGAAVLRALERDRAGWISGALADEPSAMVSGCTAGLAIEHGGRRLEEAGIALYDYTSLHYLYQSCAVLAEADPGAPFFAETAAARPRLEQWCRDLQALGILPPGDVAQAARAARAQLLDWGMLPEGLALGAFNLVADLWPSLIVTYAWAYTRRPPWDPPGCMSFSATDAAGRPRALSERETALLWADANGIAPTLGISLIGRDADGERRELNRGSFRHALQHASERALAHAPRACAEVGAGRDALLAAVRAGQEEVVMSGRTGNRPVIILHGRADSLIPVNHTGRAYYAVNQRDRGARDELRYYELQHGQHFDAMLGVPAFAARYVPTQPWLLRGLDALHERLTRGTALPPSQVIRSRPRGLAAGRSAPLTVEHLGRLRPDPGADAILFERGTLTIPD